VRKTPVLSLPGALLAVVLCAGACHGLECEFHGGVYSSLEYTDNYQSTPDNKRSETTFEVGPSAEIICTAQHLSWSFSGHAARSYHNRFDDDDDTEVDLVSELTAASQRDSLELGYTFIQTGREDFFRDISGETRIHLGTLAYNRVLSSRSTVGLGYTYRTEDNTFPEQDIVSHGISGNFSHAVSTRDTVRVTAGQDAYDYEISADARVLRALLGYEHVVSPRTDVGIDLEYRHVARDEGLPDSDIKSAYLFWERSLTPQTRVRLSGGYSLLSMDHVDDESAFVARAELSTEMERDTFRFALSREYTAEFTTDEYGTYDVRRASATWERELLRTLRLAATITYVERKPVSEFDAVTGIERWEEEDIGGMISLLWSPLRYIDITSSYERIREDDENTDAVIENRYRMIVEVRY
jgi:hypothetical protein